MAWLRSHLTLPHYYAELIGTFFLVFFGCGSVILAETGMTEPGPAIPVVFGATVAIMIYAVGHISGAHFNPAVTIAFWMSGRLDVSRIPGYIFSQCLGAVLASLAHRFVWGIGHSFGATALNTGIGPGIFLELLLSFALMFVIISVATDARAVGELAGIAIGTTVTVCAFVGGPLTGASMNPARSLGPALLSGELDMLWLYMIVPVAGTCLGALAYERIRCAQEEESGGPGSGCC